MLGIILNGMMQGYVTANTIYVFLIENIEEKINISCGIKPGEEKNPDRLFEYHSEKIQGTLDQIAFYSRKKAKLEYELRQAQAEIEQEKTESSQSLGSMVVNFLGIGYLTQKKKAERRHRRGNSITPKQI